MQLLCAINSITKLHIDPEWIPGPGRDHNRHFAPLEKVYILRVWPDIQVHFITSANDRCTYLVFVVFLREFQRTSQLDIIRNTLS